MAKFRSKAVLQIGTDDPPASPGADTYQTVNNLTSVVGLDAAKAELSTTDFDSTGQEFIGDLTDFGGLVVSGHRNIGDTGQETARGDMSNSGRQRNIRLQVHDPSLSPTLQETIDFVGEIFEFSQDLTQGSPGAFTMRIRASGQPTYT